MDGISLFLENILTIFFWVMCLYGCVIVGHLVFFGLDQAISNLAKAFENGFDNYSTVRGDPDLDPIKREPDFIKLMDSYETKGFNPFGFFGKK